jgi:4-amino-4-deoxy-L-arabinose transferase-like glycosyltransferase
MNKIQLSPDNKDTNILHCNHCKAELPPHAHFCGICGACIEQLTEGSLTLGELEEGTELTDIEQTQPLLPPGLAGGKAATIAVKEQGSLPKPALMLQARHILERTPVAVVFVVVGLITFLIQGYRLSAGPDVFSDEGSYLMVGMNVARGIGFIVDNQRFFYHPPAYFLIEAAYIKLTGLTNADPITALFSVRYLNIFFSALTASVLLLCGRKLHSNRAGWIMVALFVLDSYVQRINRRNMLETFTMLCLLLGIYLFFSRRERLMKWQWLGAGVAFGLAVLSKEPMFIPLFALLGVAVWTRRTQLMDAVRVVIIACLIYLAYPLGELVTGQGPAYLSFKLGEVDRLVQSVTGAGLATTAQKTASPQNIWGLLGAYASSYLLIALAGVFTIVLFLRYRHLIEGRYLLAWSVLSFGYIFILGRISDQYFYFLIVPSAVIVNGYVLAKLFDSAQSHRWLGIVLSLFLCLLLIYNSAVWVIRYAYGSDDGYARIITYIKTRLPPGETIDVSDDVSYYLLSPTYNVRLDRDKGEIMDLHEHYFIISSKDRWGGYNGTTPEFYDWVVKNSQPLVVEDEESFWTIGLYYFKEPGVTSTPVPPQTSQLSLTNKILLADPKRRSP